MGGVLTDINGIPVVVDVLSGCLSSITREHHEIHQGDHFTAHDVQNAIATVDYLFTTPAAKHIHLVLGYGTDGKVVVTGYRNPTATTGATKLTAVNSNHNSANTSTIDISSNPSAITPGTDIILMDLVGSGPHTGAAIRGEVEMVLKPSTKYLFQFVGTSNPALAVHFYWYESD